MKMFFIVIAMCFVSTGCVAAPIVRPTDIGEARCEPGTYRCLGDMAHICVRFTGGCSNRGGIPRSSGLCSPNSKMGVSFLCPQYEEVFDACAPVKSRTIWVPISASFSRCR